MKKTVFPPFKQVIEDMDKISRDLQDVKSVLCCIAYQQDDKILQVPFDALAAMPKGIELEISVDRVHGNYVFRCIVPGDEHEQMAGGNKEGETSPTPGNA